MVITKGKKTELVEFEIRDQKCDGRFSVTPLEHRHDARAYRRRVVPVDLAAMVKNDECTLKLNQDEWIQIHQNVMNRLNRAAKSIEKPCRTSRLVPTDQFWRDTLAICMSMSSRWFSLLRTNDPNLCNKQGGGQPIRGRTTTT